VDVPHTFVWFLRIARRQGQKFPNGRRCQKGSGAGQVGWGNAVKADSRWHLCHGHSAYDGCIRENLVPGQPLLSPTHSSFDVGQVFLHQGAGCTANPDGTFSAPAGVATYWNCAAFIDPNAANLVAARGYTFGDLPRIIGSVRSQQYFNEDFSIIKRLSLFESHSLVLKAELFNAFNRHVFTRPDTGLQDGTLGASSGTVNNPRNVQFTLRYDF
jgi:hypothetical protein